MNMKIKLMMLIGLCVSINNFCSASESNRLVSINRPKDERLREDTMADVIVGTFCPQTAGFVFNMYSAADREAKNKTKNGDCFDRNVDCCCYYMSGAVGIFSTIVLGIAESLGTAGRFALGRATYNERLVVSEKNNN